MVGGLVENKFILKTLKESVYLDSETCRIFLEPNTDSVSEAIYYELKWKSKDISLKKLNRYSLIELERYDYTCDFIVETATFCKFSTDEISFCCGGGKNITHFKEKIEHTSRTLPFTLKTLYFIQGEKPGLLFISQDVFSKNYIFWLDQSFNNLHPVVNFDNSYLNPKNILIIPYKYEDLILCRYGDKYYKTNVTFRKSEKSQLNDSVTSKSLIQSVLDFSSFLNVKHDRLPRELLSFQNNASARSLLSELTDESFQLNSYLNNSLHLHEFNKSMLQDDYNVFFLKDNTFTVKLNLSNFNYKKILLTYNIMGYNFFYFLNEKKLEIFSMKSENLLVSRENITDIVELSSWCLIVAFDVDGSIHLYHGDQMVCTLHSDLNKNIFSRLIIWDKILLSDNKNLLVLHIPAISSNNKILSDFLKNILQLSVHVGDFYVYILYEYITSYKDSNSLFQFVGKLICRIFNTEYSNIPLKSSYHSRMRFAISPLKARIHPQHFDFHQIPSHLAQLYDFILTFYQGLIQKNHTNSVYTSFFENIISNIQLRFQESNEVSNFPLFFSFEKMSKFDKNFPKALVFCQPYKNKHITNDTSNLGFGETTIFPVNFESSTFPKNILLETEKYLDWSIQSVFYVNSEEVFSNDSRSEYEVHDDITNQEVNRQKINFACLLNQIYSKPIGQAALNFGKGLTENHQSMLKLSHSSINYKTLLNIKEGNNVVFKLGVTLEPNDICQPAVQWPLFHNGVSLAFSSLSSNTKYLTFDDSINLESWLNQTLEILSREESGGFLFGCGLLGHLYMLPLRSPGFIFNFFLRHDNFTVCGMLLGLGASHAQCYKKENPELVRRLQTTFLIHSGLSSFSSDFNRRRTDGGTQDVFEFCRSDSIRCFSVQAASIISLGLVHLGSGDNLILNILKRFFDTLIKNLSTLSPHPRCLNSKIPQLNFLYHHKSIAIVTGIAIGLINCGSNSNDIFWWASYYSHYVKLLSSNDNIFSHYLESVYIMITLSNLRSNDQSIANLLDVSDYMIAKQTVKPYLVLLSQWFKGLVMDENLKPNNTIFKQLPNWFRPCYKLPSTGFLTINFVYCWSALTGLLFALCFKYESTRNLNVYSIVVSKIKLLSELFNSMDPKRRKNFCFVSNLKSCLACLVLGLCLVFSGSCHSEIKILIASLRSGLRSKVPKTEKIAFAKVSHYTSPVAGDYGFGFHMALHQALGILCLGHGLITFTTSSVQSFAMLVLSLYPVFPNVPSDVMNFFQPLRHFFALSCTKSHMIYLSDPNSQEFKKKKIILKTLSLSGQSSKLNFHTKYHNYIPLKEAHELKSVEILIDGYLPIKLSSEDLVKRCTKTRFFDMGEYLHINLQPVIRNSICKYPVYSKFGTFGPDWELIFPKITKFFYLNNCDILVKNYKGRIQIKILQTLGELQLTGVENDDKLLKSFFRCWQYFTDRQLNVSFKVNAFKESDITLYENHSNGIFKEGFDFLLNLLCENSSQL